MALKIEGIPVTAQSVINTYKMFYPQTYAKIMDNNKFHYLYLFGIRVSTCDTSLPDDMVGGIRVNRFNILEMVVGKASTEPSPKNLANLFDAEARAKGGAAFVMEGEHLYAYYGTNHPKFKPLPAFYPIDKGGTRVYRWMPNDADIKAWNKGKGRPLSASFEQAKKEGRVRISTSTDTMIHKTWSKQTLFADSAGCQVIQDDKALIQLGKWAVEHRNRKYPNRMIYTLFTKEQFLAANQKKPNLTVSFFQSLFNLR